MQVRDLTETECQEVLQRLNLGRIACAKDNQPYVVPAYFYLDGRYLYSFGTLGQKIEWMRANPRVCVEVDEGTDGSHWTTVIAFGYYEELRDTPEHNEARQRALALFQTRRAWWSIGGGEARDARASRPDRLPHQHHAADRPPDQRPRERILTAASRASRIRNLRGTLTRPRPAVSRRRCHRRGSDPTTRDRSRETSLRSLHRAQLPEWLAPPPVCAGADWCCQVSWDG